MAKAINFQPSDLHSFGWPVVIASENLVFKGREMRVIIYDSSDDESVEKFVKFIQELPEGKKYRFEVNEVRAIRSLGQNRRYWAIINIIATETGHTQEEIDYMFRMARHHEIVFYPNGTTEKIPSKTSNRDTKDFTIIMNNLEQWCRENFPEVKLVSEKDLTYERWLQIEDEYHRVNSGF